MHNSIFVKVLGPGVVLRNIAAPTPTHHCLSGSNALSQLLFNSRTLQNHMVKGSYFRQRTWVIEDIPLEFSKEILSYIGKCVANIVMEENSAFRICLFLMIKILPYKNRI